MLVSIKTNPAATAAALTDRRLAGAQIAEQLAAAEAAIDAAIAAVATLTAIMPMARLQAGVGAHVGQDALMHAMESCSQLVKSRTNILRTHKALAGVQRDVGLGETAFMSECPPGIASADETTRHLALVAA